MEAKDHSKLRPHFCGITWGDETEGQMMKSVKNYRM